jgi:hypothetical protein
MKEQFIQDVGHKYTIDKKSIILQLFSVTKENKPLADSELKTFIKIMNQYFDAISNNKNSIRDYFGEIMTPLSINQIENQAFYRFISPEEERRLKKGNFQLGSLQKYREIEDQNRRDEFEGISSIIIKSNNREVFTTVLTGFNYYILCGTCEMNNSEYMSEKYGSKILRISNVKSFSNAVCKSIGAKKWYLQKVQYSDFKAYKIEHEIKTLETSNLSFNEEIFDILYKHSFFPSIFVKPTRFNTEKELRLIFEMPKDVRKELKFDNLGLVNQIKICK